MKLRGPLATLVVALAFGLVLLLANRTQNPEDTAAAAAAPQPAAEAVQAADAAAPPAEQQAAEAVYVGRTEPEALTVAIAVTGDQAAAYLCDGKKVEAWMQGTVTDGQVTLEGEEGGRLTGTIDGDTVTGTAWLSQTRKWEFSATVAGPPAGLYTAEDADGGIRVGWIVLPSGEQVGVIERQGSVNGSAPRLETGKRDTKIEGRKLEVKKVRGVEPCRTATCEIQRTCNKDPKGPRCTKLTRGR